MHEHHDYYWTTPWYQTALFRTIVASLVVHVLVLAGAYRLSQIPPRITPPKVLTFEFIPQKQDVQPAPKPEPPKPKPEPPKPKPEPPKPKPEPPKPKPKPAVKKEVPKPKPKPEPPKPEPPKPKPKPPPPKPKPEPPKPKPEPPKPKPEPPKPKPEPVKPATKAVAVKQEAFPEELAGWARRVQRKIEGIWVVPGGIRLDAEDAVAEVEFWVDRNGSLLSTPVVIKEASDPRVGESGVRAIRLANPVSPLPDKFKKDKQRVVYAFSLAR
jgi:hypothetical protein